MSLRELRDMSPAETSARVLAIVENYVHPAMRRKAADAITDLLIETMQAMSVAAMAAHKEGVRQARMEANRGNN